MSDLSPQSKESPATGGPDAGLLNHKPRQYIRGRGGLALGAAG